MSPRRRLPWQVKWVTLALVWGSSFLLMKFGLRAMEPLQIAAVRIWCGAATLLILLRIVGGRLPREPRVWGHLMVSAAFLTVLPFIGFAAGETRVSSALAGIGNSITPVAMVIFGLILLPSERITRTKLISVGLGFVGVLIIAEPWNAVGRPDPLGFAIVLAAGACYGVGWTYNRRYLGAADLGGLSQPAALLLSGAVLMVPTVLISAWVGGGAPWAQRAGASSHDVLVGVGATLVLGIVGTGLAYMLQYDVVRDTGTVISSMVTYLIPVVSVILGVVVLGEHLGPAQLGGFVLVLGAALLVGRPAAGWGSLFARRPRRDALV